MTADEFARRGAAGEHALAWRAHGADPRSRSRPPPRAAVTRVVTPRDPSAMVTPCRPVIDIPSQARTTRSRAPRLRTDSHAARFGWVPRARLRRLRGSRRAARTRRAACLPSRRMEARRCFPERVRILLSLYHTDVVSRHREARGSCSTSRAPSSATRSRRTATPGATSRSAPRSQQ